MQYGIWDISSSRRPCSHTLVFVDQLDSLIRNAADFGEDLGNAELMDLDLDFQQAGVTFSLGFEDPKSIFLNGSVILINGEYLEVVVEGVETGLKDV